MKPSVGRIVHFVHKVSKRHIPAIITMVWSDTCISLRLFYDGSNDEPYNTEWETSVSYEATGADPRTWHWPERE